MMTFKEWRSLWRFDRTVDIPHLSATLMCPWAFARVLWYYNRREFQAWPSEYETSFILGWRWPFTKTFREKKWAKIEPMPLAIYGGPMDEIYLDRVAHEIHMHPQDDSDRANILQVGVTVRRLREMAPFCEHKFWTADCRDCVRKALRMAVRLTSTYQPVRSIDPHESPIDGFRRREAEAKARLQASVPQHLPESTE